MNGGHSRRAWGLSLLAVSVAAAVCRAEPPEVGGNGRSSGIWKAVVPPKPMNGEFDSFDPLGVEAGAKIKADCSLNWINPDDGKRYCFSSGTSLEFFLDRPQAHIERARAGWRKMALGETPARP
jgi:hypothetical protein